MFEATIGSFFLWYSAFSLIIYNGVYNSFLYYGIVGIIQLLGMFVWSASLFIRVFYNAVIFWWLYSKYDILTYSTIVFFDPISIFVSEEDFFAQLIWWEQLFFGNRRSALYVNFLMAIIFAAHPMTISLSWYFLFQIPAALLFETIIYPIFPQFDTPYIPWIDFFEYVFNGFVHNDVTDKGIVEPIPREDIILDGNELNRGT